MANKKTQFRETFEEMLDNGKDIFLVDKKCEQDALNWWFDQYCLTDTDLKWLIERICADFEPLKNLAMGLIQNSLYPPGKSRSSKVAFKAAKVKKEQRNREVLSVLHFSYRFQQIISGHDCNQTPYPNNINPYKKCGDYYDCEDLRMVIERGWIEPTLDNVESHYRKFKPIFSRSSLRL